MPTRVVPTLIHRRAAAAAIGCAAFVLIGWSGLLVPALVPEVETAFGQTDVGIGFFYLVTGIVYAAGSVFGGMTTERVGRRTVLVGAAILHGVGLLAQADTGSWTLFVVGGLLRAVGAGALDGGVNGLIIDLYPAARGRALNAVHLFFALGALGAPFAIAGSSAIVPWPAVIAATGLATLPIAVLLAVTELADGRRVNARSEGFHSRALGLPLLALGVAIGCYVAAEIGVSNWLVRFLEEAPAAIATSALGLYWAGLTLGRLVSARVGDRFDHVALAIAASLVASVALVAAVAAPTVELSIALFAVVGFASGPIYPLIMAIGGERFPDRAAAMSGILGAAAVVGSIVYPPLMGAISVTVGLPIAMFGTAAIGLGTVVALVAVGRLPAVIPVRDPAA